MYSLSVSSDSERNRRTWLEFTNVGVRMFIEVKRYVQGEHILILVRRYVIAKLVNPSLSW